MACGAAVDHVHLIDVRRAGGGQPAEAEREQRVVKEVGCLLRALLVGLK